MDRQALINFLKKGPKTIDEIANQFKLRTNQASSYLKVYLDSGLIVETVSGYDLVSRYGLILARLVLRKTNFAYLEVISSNENKKYEDIRVSNISLNGYILSDIVYVQFDNFNTASIVGLYKRVEYLTGNIYKSPKGGFNLHSRLLENSSIQARIVTNLNDVKLSDGDLVKCKIISSYKEYIDLEFEEVLVKANQVGADISSIIVNNDAPLNFPSQVIEQAKIMPKEVIETDLENRVDFRNETIVTIDGEDALDFDDAISVKKIANGFELGVYIADVSYYVKPNTPIDEEANVRGTSIYVADRVVPMLPVELSNGICSLNPHVDRLVLACIMQVSSSGEVYSYKVCQGVINSKARLTYSQVNSYYETNNSENLDKSITKMLDIALQLSQAIRKRRERQGALDLESTELKFHLDENGNPIEILKKEQGIGEKLIEDFMIVTNCSIANFLAERNIPTLYRIHENPPEDKINTFKIFLKNIKLAADFPKIITPVSLSVWFNSIKDKKLRFVVSSFLLRSLAKAKYSPLNEGHFGLAEPCYLHFTSPIRRYPDLLVHRTIRNYVFNREKLNYSEYFTYMTNQGISTSSSERRATSIEREVDDLEACKYMKNHIGETYSGIITNIVSKGMYLQLENGIDCYLDIENINPEKEYTYSSKHFDIQSKRSKFNKNEPIELYKLGQSLDVVISKVTFEDKQIHVITKTYDQYLENLEKYNIEVDKQEKEFKKAKDNSRVKKHLGRRSKSYLKKQGKPSRGHYGKKARK